MLLTYPSGILKRQLSSLHEFIGATREHVAVVNRVSLGIVGTNDESFSARRFHDRDPFPVLRRAGLSPYMEYPSRSISAARDTAMTLNRHAARFLPPRAPLRFNKFPLVVETRPFLGSARIPRILTRSTFNLDPCSRLCRKPPSESLVILSRCSLNVREYRYVSSPSSISTAGFSMEAIERKRKARGSARK